MEYTKTTWNLDAGPPINDTNLNNIENGIETIDNKFSWSEITADPAPATKSRGYFCDTSGGAFTLTLPDSSGLLTGDFVSVADLTGSFGSNNLTIAVGSGDVLMGVVDDTLDLVTNYDFVTLTWSGNATYGWIITSKP